MRSNQKVPKSYSGKTEDLTPPITRIRVRSVGTRYSVRVSSRVSVRISRVSFRVSAEFQLAEMFNCILDCIEIAKSLAWVRAAVFKLF